MPNRLRCPDRRSVAALFLVGVLCHAGISTAPAASPDAELPRYWLKVGQEINYHASSEFAAEDGRTLVGESSWQIWVIKQNADSTWRLILRHAASFQTSGGAAAPPAARAPAPRPKPNRGRAVPSRKKPATSRAGQPGAASPAPTAMPEQVTFAYCDFSPDGSIAPNSTLGFQFELRQLLPKLAQSKKELKKGWTDLDRSTQVSYRYHVEQGPSDDEDDDDEGARRWTLVAARQSPVDDIYLSRTQSTFVFDGDRGLVERVETKLDQGYGSKGTGTATTELVGVEQFNAAWCAKLEDEMGLYFGVQRRYQSLLRAAERNSVDAETLLVEAGAMLQKASAEITLPVVKEDLGKQVAMHAAMIGRTARAARDRADLLDQPAPAWQTKDLEGDLHALRDYRGKVVVLHFWRRGDGWGLRALPQVERLAEQFADQPVAVLGMNTDPDEKDGRFVADKMGLAYPLLRAEKFADKYNAPAAGVVVIDQKGIIRDARAGYSPTLAQDVAGVVSGLLKEE